MSVRYQIFAILESYVRIETIVLSVFVRTVTISTVIVTQNQHLVRWLN